MTETIAQSAASDAAYPGLPLYAPDVPPFDHQAEALRRGWSRPGYGYLLEMGLGKSRVLIDNFCMLYVNEQVDALLIVAPKGVYSNWTRESEENPGELQKWMWSSLRQSSRTYTWVSGKSQRDVRGRGAILDHTHVGPMVLCVNAEALSAVDAARQLCRDFLRSHRTMIVVDESTLMKERKSRRTKVVTELGRLAQFRRILSGSPMTKSPSDLFSQFNFLQPGCLGYSSFVAFQARYCVMRDLEVSGRRIQTEVGTQNLDELARQLEKHSFRKRKRECLDLPPKMYERRVVELTDQQEKAYEEMRTSAMATLESGETVTTQIVVTQLMRLHQIVCGHIRTDTGEVLRLESNRLPALLEVTEDTEDQMIIWANYRSDLAAVSRSLRERWGQDSVAEWHGDVPVSEREAGEADFVAGRRRFMLASQQAGGLGRTWTQARTVVYYSNNHDLMLREQSEDRAHRIGQTGTVLYIDLVAPRTIDEKIIDALRSKKNVVAAVLQDGPQKWL